MGRIVAFGCSNTYGLGLPDNCDPTKINPEHIPASMHGPVYWQKN